jgi:hypothetical protein
VLAAAQAKRADAVAPEPVKRSGVWKLADGCLGHLSGRIDVQQLRAAGTHLISRPFDEHDQRAARGTRPRPAGCTTFADVRAIHNLPYTAAIRRGG